MGIKAYAATQFWTPERVALLGTALDREVGRLVGASPSSVSAARRKRGIPGFCTPSKMSRAHLALLGTRPDKELASQWACHPSYVAAARRARETPAFQAQKHWTAAEIALLGTMSDAEVARRVGRSKAAVTAARRSRGIAGAATSSPHPHLHDIMRGYTRTTASVLEIATRYGVSPAYIHKRVRERGWRRPGSA